MDTYKVTAITTWSVEWSVAGQPGVIETATRSSRDVLIGEYQAVNVKPGRCPAPVCEAGAGERGSPAPASAVTRSHTEGRQDVADAECPTARCCRSENP